MIKELSRVQSRQKKVKGKERPSVKAGRAELSSAEPPKQREITPGILTRSNRTKTYSKKEKAVNEGEKGSQDGGSTPSRAQTYTSERVRLSKLFVNSLILIFVILLFSLLLWGIKGAPNIWTLL